MSNHGKKIGELVTQLSHELLLVKKRWYFLEAITKEFAQYDKTQSGQVIIRNFTVYDMIRDSYEMLIIDLASICKHFIERGGVFGKIGARLNEVKPPSKKSIEVRKPNIIEEPGHPVSEEARQRIYEDHERYERERLSGGVKKAISRLFPDWNGQKVRQEDLKGLKARFLTMIAKLKTDRNVFRAHKFEVQSRSERQTTDSVTMEDIKSCFKAVEDILVDLSLICDLASRHFDHDLGHSQRTAKDVADLILNGSINNMFINMDLKEISHGSGEKFQYYWQFREKIAPVPPERK